jgi:cytoskeletal protein CcmA (bactofilin family)
MIPGAKDSVIGEGVTLRGGVTTRGGLQIAGEVYGEVRADRISMGETAVLEGSAEAEIVEIRGRLTGTISGRDVRLYATAQVEADITYQQLSIELGARFQGRCLPADAMRAKQRKAG